MPVEIGRLIYSIEGDLSDLEREMARAPGIVEKNINAAKSRSNAALASFFGNVASNAVSRLADLGLQGASAWLNYSSNLQQVQIGFERLEGGAANANRQLTALRQFANTTPFTFEGLLPTAQRLEEVGKRGDALLPVLRDIGNVVAGTVGRNGQSLDDRLNSVSNVIKQVLDTGRLQGDELEQLSENGINGLQILSSQLGLTTAEVRKLIEQGKISGEVFLKAFQIYSQQNFGDAMVRQSKTFQGALSTIQDSLLSTANSAFEPLFKKISEITVRIGDEAQKTSDLNQIGALLAAGIVEGFADALAFGLQTSVSRLFTTQGISDAFFFWQKAIGKGLYEAGRDIRQSFDPQISKPEDFNKNLQLSMQRNAEATEKATQASAKYREELNKLFAEGQAKQQAEALSAVIKDLSAQFEFFGQKTVEAATKQKLLGKGLEDLSSAEAQFALRLARTIDRMRENQKVYDTYAQTTDDLIFKIRFFGDESERAAVSQRLLAAGILDLNSANAKVILQMADYYDKLKKAKEESDQFEQSVKNARDEIKQLRDNANFEFHFPNATDLDRFNEKVRQGGNLFKGLQREVNATRIALELLAISRAASARDATIYSFIQGLNDEIKSLLTQGQQLSKFDEILKDLGQNLGLSGYKSPQGIDFSTEKFINETKLFIQAYRVFQEAVIDPAEKDAEKYREALNKLKESYKNFLRSFTTEKNGARVAIFPDDVLDSIIEKFFALDDAVKQSTRAMDAFNKKTGESAEDVARQVEETQTRVQEFLSRIGLSRQELIENLQINAMEGVFDSVNRGIDGFIEKIGLANTALGSFISEFLRGLARLAINQIFQMLFGGGTGASGANGAGGGGGGWFARIFGWILGAALGGIGGGGTAGSPAPSAGGAAMGGFFEAVPGGQLIKIAEGGFPEMVISTNPAYQQRSDALLSQYARLSGRTASDNSPSSVTIINNFHADARTGAFSRPSAAQTAKQMADLQRKAVTR